MKFTKMQGAGNDYIYINLFEETVEDPCELAIKLSDRHFGIGGDGIVLIGPSQVADFRMQMFNIDGSEGGMCGNATRCVCKYVYDNNMASGESISLETATGIKELVPEFENNKVTQVKVDMGIPKFKAEDIPVIADDDDFIDMPINCSEGTFRATCVSMGNPHAVIIVEDPDTAEVEEIGPVLEHNPIFPDRANIEFISILDRKNIKMRVWERGSGETLACGTGACAALVACVKLGITDRNANVMLRGGVLNIEWDEETDHVFMNGPAETVFTGEIEL